MAKDAIEGYLEVLGADGRPLPQRSSGSPSPRNDRLPSVRPRQLIRVLKRKGWEACLLEGQPPSLHPFG
jgi:hypothetical protein